MQAIFISPYLSPEQLPDEDALRTQIAGLWRQIESALQREPASVRVEQVAEIQASVKSVNGDLLVCRELLTAWRDSLNGEMARSKIDPTVQS